MGQLESKLITGVTASDVTNRRLGKEIGLQARQQLAYMVFETKLDGKTYYCCWSGGALIDGDVHLTQVGRAAMETLDGLPVGDNNTLVMQQLKIGATPLRDKVEATLRRFPSGSKVCFFGDMSGELDGEMHAAFNVTGSVEITA